MPDLEGPKFYNEELEKKPKTLKLRLIIKQGLFYTLFSTPKEFDRLEEDGNPANTIPFGRVAYFAAGELASDGGGGQVTIRLGREGRDVPQTLSLRATGGRKYYIFFLNACPEDECDFDPTSSVKENRGDFHLYRKTYKLPRGKNELGLKLRGNREGNEAAFEAATRAATPLVTNLLSLDILKEIFSSFESPCGVAYYGQTTDGFGGS